jgi:hypothetical protein
MRQNSQKKLCAPLSAQFGDCFVPRNDVVVGFCSVRYFVTGKENRPPSLTWRGYDGADLRLKRYSRRVGDGKKRFANKGNILIFS